MTADQLAALRTLSRMAGSLHRDAQMWLTGTERRIGDPALLQQCKAVEAALLALQAAATQAVMVAMVAETGERTE